MSCEVVAGRISETVSIEATGPRRSVLPRGDDFADVRTHLAVHLSEIRQQYQLQRRRLIDSLLSVDAKGAGELFDLSERAWRRLDVTGEIPKPVKIGRSVRWQLKELAAWLEAGCPDRETWEAMK